VNVNAASPVQFEEFSVKTLRVVPLAYGRGVNRRLVVNRGAELLDLLVADLRHSLVKLGEYIRQRSGLANGVECQMPVWHYKY